MPAFDRIEAGLAAFRDLLRLRRLSLRDLDLVDSGTQDVELASGPGFGFASANCEVRLRLCDLRLVWVAIHRDEVSGEA
ncbi:hypothetical protein GS982_02425 [Rhodococcus hoagii]|nr:hypothetical protein [Prescottella equi]